MKKTTTLKALALSMIMTLGLVMPMMAQSDGFFRNNDDLYANRADAYSITNQTFGDENIVFGQGLTNQTFASPLGSGLLIMVAAGAGYVVVRRKRARKGMTLLLAAAMLLGMTQCKKRIETVTPSQQHGTFITLKVTNDAKHQVITSGSQQGQVHYTDGDLIFVANGGNLVGVLQYCSAIPEIGLTDVFAGEIGIDLLGEEEPLPLDPDDYLHFAFFGNAALDENNGVLTIGISGQKKNLPVISYAKTEYLYSYYEEQEIKSFDCELQNQCALVKFTLNNVNGAVGTISGDDEVCISGMLTTARLNISQSGVTITPDPTSTGSITLYHPSGRPDNERWGILLPQGSVTGANMLIRNWKFTGNVNVDEIVNNELQTETVDCSGTPTKVNFFTVRQGKKASFSPGNLQYRAAGDTTGFRFAKHQWDYVGGYWEKDNVTYRKGNVYTKIGETVVQCENNAIANNYNGWIDLFGFGTGQNPTNCSIDTMQYKQYKDWGKYNAIYNPKTSFTDPAGTWYAPNVGELLCLINFAPNDDASGLGYQDDIRIDKCAPATVHGVGGLVLLPDYFEWPNSDLEEAWSPMPYDQMTGWNDYTRNEFIDTDWGLMENNGAVFLPAAGIRVPSEKDGNVVNNYYYNTYNGSMDFYYWAENPYYRERAILMLWEYPAATPYNPTVGCNVRLMRKFEF